MPEKTIAEKAAADTELMQIWGELNAEWDWIEQCLFRLFDAFVVDTESANRAVFFSQHSHAARRTMLAELANIVLRDDTVKANKLAVLIKRIKARSDARNALAHGMWHQIKGENGDSEIFRAAVVGDVSTQVDERNVYGRRKLQRTLNDMKDTRAALEQFVAPLWLEKSGKRTAESFDED